jgi:sarcosine dehydrogenase
MRYVGHSFYVAIGGGLAQHAYSHMLNALQDHKWKCHLIDNSEQMSMISVQGPKRYVDLP